LVTPPFTPHILLNSLPSSKEILEASKGGTNIKGVVGNV
jgi:hypothetical protein